MGSMENGHITRSNRKFGLLLLLYLLVLYKSLIVHVLIENKYPEWISLPPRAQATLQFDLEQDDLLAAPKWRRSFNTNIRRSQMPTVYYRNSTSTFRPINQLIHDIEPNPGPDHLVSDFKRKSNSNLTIAHLNARSLKCRDHFVLVKETIVDNKFDVFTISESWLDNSVNDLEIEVPDYNLYRIDRQNKKGGGICAYISRNYKTELIRDISHVTSLGFHQLWLKVQVKKLKSFVVCTTYRPPDTPLSCFDVDLAISFMYVSSLNLPIYILGDLNCNLLDRECQTSEALSSFYRFLILSQLITTPTRVTASSKSLLDVILVSDMKQVQKANVMHCSVSDHDLIYVMLRLKKPRTKPVYITTRSFKNYKPEAFYNDISLAPWSIVDIFDEVNDKLHVFNSLFHSTLDQHAPIKTIKIRGKPNPCVTDNIRGLMKTRDLWRKKAKKTNDLLAWSAYKNFKREVKREIRLAEKELVADQIQSNPNDSNIIWKAIRLCILKKSSSKRTFSKDDKTVAEEFNRFFVSVGPTSVDKIKAMANDFKFDLDDESFFPKQYPLSEQFAFQTIECKDIENIVLSLPSSKAPGIDKIPIRVIKDSLVPILPAITSIVNASLSSSTFPSCWKTAEVTPLPKEGDHEQANNNRPISLLPVLSKVCERVVHNQFSSYLTSKGLLSKKQSGNKVWHFTETSVIKTTTMDKKKLTAIVLLDKSKAFDSISHKIGASRSLIQWFTRYLSERHHVVKINSAFSEPLPLVSSVPQGR